MDRVQTMAARFERRPPDYSGNLTVLVATGCERCEPVSAKRLSNRLRSPSLPSPPQTCPLAASTRWKTLAQLCRPAGATPNMGMRGKVNIDYLSNTHYPPESSRPNRDTAIRGPSVQEGPDGAPLRRGARHGGVLRCAHAPRPAHLRGSGGNHRVDARRPAVPILTTALRFIRSVQEATRSTRK